MLDIDLFIPAAPKDYIKLPYVLQSVARNLSEIKQAHIVTPTPISIDERYPFGVVYHLDYTVLDFDYMRFKFRPTWVYQQFLKLFQQVTGEWYLVMDADRFINRPQVLFDGETPIMFLRDRDENHAPYFEYNRQMIGVGRVFEHSFLSECTLYSRFWIESMLIESGLTVDDWLERSAEIITHDCCIADAELYGSFVYSWRPDLYQYRVLHDRMWGKYASQGDWSPAEIVGCVAEMSQHADVDFFTAHSWHD